MLMNDTWRITLRRQAARPFVGIHGTKDGAPSTCREDPCGEAASTDPVAKDPQVLHLRILVCHQAFAYSRRAAAGASCGTDFQETTISAPITVICSMTT